VRPSLRFRVRQPPGFDQAVVWSAAEGFVGDLGVSAFAPVHLGIVDLAAVAGHGTARETFSHGPWNDGLGDASLCPTGFGQR
jgi:hypothetical protein